MCRRNCNLLQALYHQSPFPKRCISQCKWTSFARSGLCTFSSGDTVTMETQDDSDFSHDEVDITMISYVVQVTNQGKNMTHVLSDDSDVFVLLVYWVHRASLQCKVHLEQLDGTLATCTDLEPKSLHVLGMISFSRNCRMSGCAA